MMQASFRRRSPLLMIAVALAFLGAFIALSLIALAPAAEAQSPSKSVQNLTLNQSALTSLDVSWDRPNPSPIHYEVNLYAGNTASGVAFRKDIKWDYNTDSHRFTSLTTGQTYTVTVGVLYFGEEEFTNHVSATITLSDGSVENLTATPVSDDAVRLSWGPPIWPDDIDSYAVFIYPEGNFAETVDEAHPSSDTTGYRFSGLVSETSYVVSVQAIGSIHNTAGSTADFTTLATPGAVTGLSATSIVNGLSVSWTERPESENIFAYELQYTRDGSAYTTSTPIIVTEGNSKTLSLLTPGQKEKVRVRACGFSGVAGEGLYCGAWAETTGTPTAAPTALLEAPSAPQNLSLTLSEDGNRLRVKWDAPATGWEPAKMIEANSAYKFRYDVILQNETSGKAVWKRPGYKKTQVVFRNLTSGATYEVSVQARIRDAQRNNADDNDNWVKSEWVSDTVTVPSQGESDSSTDIGSTTFELVWTELQAGEARPPDAVGSPTRHVRLNHATNLYERFDPVAECNDYAASWAYMASIAAVSGARSAARNQADALAAAEAELEKQKQFRTDMLAKTGGGNQQLRDMLDGRVASAQSAVDAASALLATKVSELNAKCVEAFPADEGLTQADHRWVQVPKPLELVGDE